MKILKSWLKDYIDTKISDEELAEKFTASSCPVDEFTKTIPDTVVVAEILSIRKHPNADRLQIAEINDGRNKLKIVCGAPNIAVGQKVPLAKTGTLLSSGLLIKESEIRGEMSEGMLCAFDELGIGDDHSGIIILSENEAVGRKVNEILESDTIFDIDVTPNRGDILSHLGFARDLAAIVDRGLESVRYSIKEKSGKGVEIEVENQELCPQYYVLKIEGIKTGDSPKWLRDRLERLGQKSINNIVDVTNYIMLDLGQPLHAFDAKKVTDGKIIIRNGRENEEIKTLDGAVRKISPANLVIADTAGPIAIAGIMGGANSEIDIDTVDIILEAAEFDAKSIKRSTKLLNLNSDASYRFERGIDSGNVANALKKAANLIVEAAGGEIVAKITGQSRKFEPKLIPLECSKINGILGAEISEAEMVGILSQLGFESKNKSVVAPLWRHDIEITEDLAEEIGRIYGYSKLNDRKLPESRVPKKTIYYKKEYIKDLLVNLGFSEVINYIFLSEKETNLAKINKEILLEVANPLQPENKYLRNSLVPGLLKDIAKNPTFDPISLFEIGHVFSGIEEKTTLSIITAGKSSQKSMEEAVSSLKTVLGVDFNQNIDKIDREVLDIYKIRKSECFVIELAINDLLSLASFENSDLELIKTAKKSCYRPISKYPSITRDLAFIVDKEKDANIIADKLYEVSELVNRVELFDEFASDKFGKGKKNVAFHIYLQSLDRTMTDTEADSIIDKIVKEIEDKFKAKLRS
ncbi:MAG: phenylalanine--tRNA ligase subunit beta [Patescibacteria group bacterium]